MTDFKIGDIITRKDMPSMTCRIEGDNPNWNAWDVVSIGNTRGRMESGMVFKDDERWIKVKGENEN